MQPEPLRVLCFTTQFPKSKYPQKSHYIRQSHYELAKLCDFSLISPVPWPELINNRDELRLVGSGSLRLWRPAYFYTPYIIRGLHGRFLFWSSWPIIKKAARQTRAQVLFASFAYPEGYACMLAAKRLGLPFVVHVMGSDLMILGRDRQRAARIRQVMAAAAGVVAVSRALAEKARELGARAERVRWVPNGVDQGLFRPADQADARSRLGLDGAGPWLIFIGNLVDVKGIPSLLQALAKLPQARLLVVGAGPLAGGLKAQAEALGLKERVVWAGRKPLDEIPLHMAAADALVLPSKSEGEPNVAMEALAAGRPVVASRVGGVPDIVRDGRNGRCVPPGDPDQLAEAIGWTLEQNWDPAALRESVRERTWPRAAEGYLEVLQAAVQG